MIVDRSKEYGPFAESIALEAHIMASITSRYRMANGIDMAMMSQVHISKIVLKLVRLANSPNHVDTWDDISYYAEQISNHIKEQDIAKD